MSQWRVGTISLGLLLLFAGGALLWGYLSGQNAPVLLLKGWPVALVVLGVEILAYTWQRAKEQAALRYDLVSIFLIFLLVGFTLVLALVSSFGLTAYAQDILAAAPQVEELAPQTAAVPAHVRQIAVSAYRGQLRVFTADTAEVRLSGRVQGWDSAGHWQKMVRGLPPASLRVVGDTLLLDLPRLEVGHGPFGRGEVYVTYDLVVPRTCALELTGQGWEGLELRPSAVTQDWRVTASGDVRITVPKGSNLAVEAQVDQRSALGGNAPWQIAGAEPPPGPDRERAAEAVRPLEARAVFGQGKPTLRVYTRGQVAVYTN